MNKFTLSRLPIPDGVSSFPPVSEISSERVGGSIQHVWKTDSTGASRQENISYDSDSSNAYEDADDRFPDDLDSDPAHRRNQYVRSSRDEVLNRAPYETSQRNRRTVADLATAPHTPVRPLSANNMQSSQVARSSKEDEYEVVGKGHARFSKSVSKLTLISHEVG